MMSRDEDRTLFADIFEPFNRAINGDSKMKAPPVPAKLFSNGNINIDELFNRSSSFGDNQHQTPKRKRLNSESSNNASPALTSPWELKRMKGDLIEARAQIIRLESRIDHQRLIGKEMTVLFETEKQTLINQQKMDQKTISELEDRLKVVREREAKINKKLTEATNQFRENRNELEEKVQQVQRENSGLKDKIIELDFNHKSQISEMRKDMDELTQALESAQLEAKTVQEQLTKQMKHNADVSSLQNKLDKQRVEVTILNNKVKDLEFERESYKDWLVQAKAAQKRLADMPDIERQLAKMKKDESHLKELARGKLLMEEKLYTLKHQVASLEPTQKELHALTVKCGFLESALEEWQQVLKFVVASSDAEGQEVGNTEDPQELQKVGGRVGARLVKAALEKAQRNELTSLNNKMEAESKVITLKNELSTVKHEWEKAKIKLTDLEKLQQVQTALLQRLQKRVSLLIRERDSYRNQIDSYEKELTVTITGEGQSCNPLQGRVDGLEKTLQGYRELLDQMEKDKSGPDTEVTPALRDQLSRLRDEMETLRCDNEMLRNRKDQLEHQLEYRALKGDYDPSKYKILHMTNNPANVAQNQAQTDLEKAQLEIRRLRQRIHKLEAEGADMSQRLSESMVDGGSSREMQQLKQEIESGKVKLQRMKEVFTASSKEFREMCYLLLGYRIDRSGQQYKLTSVFAESPEEYLTFKLTDGEIEMVQTEYSLSIGGLVELHLHHHRSLPLFLSALTTDLFFKNQLQEEE